MDPNLAAYAAQNREEQQEEGGLLDALGKIALGAGALAAGAIGARRLAQGLKTGATVDLSSLSPKVRRVDAEYPALKEAVPPSRPAPTTAVQRQQEAIEFTRQARAERPAGVRQGNLEDMIKQVKVEDLGPTYAPVSPERAKIDLNFINNVLIPLEQKRLPSATEFLQERSTGVRQAKLTELAAAQRLAEDPELLRLVKQQEAENLSEARSYQAKAQAEYRNLLSAKADEALASIRNEGTTGAAAAQQDFAAQYLKTAGYQDDVTMVDQQAGNLIAQIDHFANASNSAEDQVTGRVKAALARNEDVNLGAVEIAEDQVDAQIARAVQGDPTVASVTEVDAAINQVADGLPDGRPADQAEGLNIRTQGIDLRTGERFPLASERPYRKGLQPGMQLEAESQAPSKGLEAAQKFLINERAEIASQLGEQGLLATPGRIEAELANRISGPQAWEYGPEYTQRKQALQLGVTYDPDLLESVATGVKPSGEVIIAGETVPVSSLREPVVMEETAQRLQERAAEKKDWLGNIRLEEQNNQIRIAQELNKLSTRDQVISDYINYVESEFPRKTSYSSPYERDITAKKQYEAEGARIEQEQISNQMESLLQQAGKSQRRVAGAERSTQEQIANLQVPEKLKAGIEEGQRIYFEQDPVTGAPIPGTQELRSERYAVETEAKRGGGRQVVEYDPFGQSGQVKDIYGTQLSTERAADPTMRPTKTGPSRKPLTQPVTPQGLRSVDVTRDIMRIEKSAPPEKAKQMVAEYLRKLQG